MRAKKKPAERARGRGPRRGGGGKGGGQPAAARGGRGRPSSRKQKHRRQQQAGSLPRRPDIKGLTDGDGNERQAAKANSKKNKNSGNKEHLSKDRQQTDKLSGKKNTKDGLREGLRQQQQKPFVRREGGEREEAPPSGAPRKRKLTNGPQRLRDLLSRHPDLLHAGESADAAVAACFKKAAEAPGVSPPGAPPSQQQQPQQQQLSGSKRRKLLRLVVRSRTAEERVYVHRAYQHYSEILRSIRASEAPAGALPPPEGAPRRLQQLVHAAIAFLEEPLRKKDRHACTARLAQVCLKHADAEHRAKLWDLLFTDVLDFCCSKAFHHVAIKLFLYGSKEQQATLLNRLAVSKEAALTRHGATVWEYIYTSQKNAVAQQRLLNCLTLEPSVLVGAPKANECHSFSQVMALLSEAQQKQTREGVAAFLQKCVDKELLDKAHVHRILRGLCRQAEGGQPACLFCFSSLHFSCWELKALWASVAEGALHLATTKDGVEALVRLLGFASAKERKTVVKALKQHCLSFACNPVDCPLLLRLLTTVDDTKLLTDHILKARRSMHATLLLLHAAAAAAAAAAAPNELLPAAEQLAFDPFGHFLLLQLLQPEGICKQLPAHYQELLALPSPTSLKEASIRQGELLPAAVKAVSTAFAGLPLVAAEGQQQHTLSAALKDACASRVLLQLAQHEAGEAAVLRAFACLESDLQQETPSLTSHPGAQRALSGLLRSRGGAPRVLSAAWGALASNLPSVLETKGVFVVLQLVKSVRGKHAELEQQMVEHVNEEALKSAEEAVTRSGGDAIDGAAASAWRAERRGLSRFFLFFLGAAAGARRQRHFREPKVSAKTALPARVEGEDAGLLACKVASSLLSSG
ncbi:hypothetical protein Efla_006259 [Eimeria flavescens]